MECDILLAECWILTSEATLNDAINKFKQEIFKKAEILGLQLKVSLFANALWRITVYFWGSISEDEKKYPSTNIVGNGN